MVSSLGSFVNSPVINFSVEETRRDMQGAIDDALSPQDRHYDLKIGGELVDSGDYIESINPSRSSEVIGTVSKANLEHAVLAVEEANKAKRSWSQTDPETRATVLHTVANEMTERIYDLSALISLEVGKTWREAHADVVEAIDFLTFYSMKMMEIGHTELTQEVLGEENTVEYIPKGVVGVIAPWNFPLAILAGMTSAAIVTGNTVVMKPAEESSLVAGELVEMFERAGLPDGVLNYLPGDGPEIGGFLVDSPDVNMIAFTGSREVGLNIYERISRSDPNRNYVKTSVLEMGGKNGIIIDSTADLDEAVPGVLQSSFGYQGQKCSASSRVIILDDVYDTFIQKIVEGAENLKVGEAHIPGVDVGPVINQESFDRIGRYIENSVEQGGKILLEGKLDDSTGFYVHPTIVEVDWKNVLAQEEVFGPVLAVIRAKDYDEAMDILNDTDYGLTGGLYSRTPSHVNQFKLEARVGNRYINRSITGSVVQRQPFGGFMMSGAGTKAGGDNYLQNFMYQIATAENTARSGHIPGMASFVQGLNGTH
jgi:RHH-type transcriptional regulator, proline utilization regulon repressor / proline dehydrogenase / delta 1-pyrroline-5-carboxylate dehydrogenase